MSKSIIRLILDDPFMSYDAKLDGCTIKAPENLEAGQNWFHVYYPDGDIVHVNPRYVATATYA